ncbi:MAG: right-handed parallel beta-helix repeat-containing protein [Actinomycetota bacterium]
MPRPRAPRLASALPLVLIVLLAAPALAKSAGAGVGGYRTVRALDNLFSPRIVRIPVGGEVTWVNEGRSVHNVVEDHDLFSSDDLEPGDAFEWEFERAGAYTFHCSYHGGPGNGMVNLVIVGDPPIPGEDGSVGPGREDPVAPTGDVVRVPEDAPTIQEGVRRARRGDLVLVGPGVYREAVVVTKPYVTIRGTDRNAVILDGGFELDNGIQVIEADGVAIENMTARNYLLNGFFWTSVFGYRGSYLTAYNNGDYGVYAYDSVYGRYDHVYASGSPDSGIYIGQCYPCHAIVTDSLAENNGLGYSGTNAGGDLWIVNSEWRNNYAGIVPNTLDSEAYPPQRGTTIMGNWVHDNENPGAAAKRLEYPSFGFGIAIPGGRENVIEGNLVEHHEAFGIVVLPNLDRNLWLPADNVVRGNVVRDSGRADLALGAPTLGGDCFEDNDFRTSLPAAIELRSGCAGALRSIAAGSLGVTFGPLVRYIEALGDFPTGDWRTQPVPSDQPQMPDAMTAPADPATPETAVPGPLPAIRPVDAMARTAPTRTFPEVTLMGFPLAAPWWGVLIGLYAYALPVILYAAWIAIALWDLVRREQASARSRMWWMVAVLAVPVVGPIAYFTLGGSTIPRSLRWMLLAGALGIYLAVALLGALAGSA